jgi:hypothetical protein
MVGYLFLNFKKLVAKGIVPCVTSVKKLLAMSVLIKKFAENDEKRSTEISESF